MKPFRPIVLASLLLGVAVCAGSAAIATPPATAAPPSASVRLVDARPASEFFGNTRVHTFELTIAAEAFASMAASHETNRHRQAGAADTGEAKVPAQLRFDGADWGRVLVRYKGNSSYRGAPSDLKVSLKVAFNGIDKKRRFFGMNEINLNNNAFDPSAMRETLSYDVFRIAGVPAPRTAFARVFVTIPGRYDHQYAGLFTAVEEIDQSFFVERWQRKTGVLAKPEDLFGMPAFGDDWKNYVRPYSLRITSRPEDAARLAAFIQFLDHASNEEFAQHVGDYLDVDEFLRFLAIEVLIVNTDSPLAMDHNYWLTVHPTTHKILWLPWDMNESFGTFRSATRGSAFIVLAPGRFPLAERLLANPAMVTRYDAILRGLLADNVSLARLEPAMREIATAIRESVAQDATMSASAFDNNFQADAPTPGRQRMFWGGHNGPPLRPFLAERIDFVTQELARSAGRQ